MSEQNEQFFASAAVLSHHVDIAVFGCMDSRVQEARIAFMEKEYGVKPGYYDPVVMAGACKQLIETGCAQLEKAVAVAMTLHEGDTIVLLQHTDCGAYGGSGELGMLEEEIAFQEVQLRTAKDKILSFVEMEALPLPKIELYIEVIMNDAANPGVRYHKVA